MQATIDNSQFNWEVILKTDEAIVEAISALSGAGMLFKFDISFLESLISWFQKRNKLTIKQSQSAIKSLCKRYPNRLQELYDGKSPHFRQFIDSAVEVKDEEFVEEVTTIFSTMECPVCDKKHELVLGDILDFNIKSTLDFTIKCDKCHTTITFIVNKRINQEPM